MLLECVIINVSFILFLLMCLLVYFFSCFPFCNFIKAFFITVPHGISFIAYCFLLKWSTRCEKHLQIVGHSFCSELVLLKVWQNSHPLKFFLVFFGKSPILCFLHVALSLTHDILYHRISLIPLHGIYCYTASPSLYGNYSRSYKSKSVLDHWFQTDMHFSWVIPDSRWPSV